jgi:murein DD-endopeptidase MepM/ murein hydrolase activator NlpD
MTLAGALAALALAAASPAPDPVSRQPPPAWEAAPVTADADEVTDSVYVVKPGDTLSLVVHKTKAGTDAIARANDLKPPYLLRPKQKLKIPAGRYQLVKRGQAGIAIARAYGAEWSRIAALNHLEEPYVLRAGMRLLLPTRTEVAKMTLEQRAAAFRIDIDDLVTGSEPALAPKARPAAPVKTAEKPVPPTVAVAQPSPAPGAAPARFIWPVKGRILRSFGRLASGARNDGINIATDRGTQILAAAEGVVAYAGNLPGFGQLVLIRHGGGWLTAYGHAEALLVTRGQAVTRGQPIARAGATGTADQPQVHFEIRDGRKPVNPIGLLPAS